jgi:hypothetical protein
MDPNKADALDEIDYRIVPCCWMCCFGHFEEGKEWGECYSHQYDHTKHTEKPRNISIHRSGKCRDYQASSVPLNKLGAYRRYYRGP